MRDGFIPEMVCEIQLEIVCENVKPSRMEKLLLNPHGPTLFRKMVFLLVLGPTRVGRLWWCMWVLCDGIDLNFFFYFKIKKSRYFDLFLIAL